jgi:phosphoglucomutase
VTDWIQTQANALLTHDFRGVKRLPFERTQRASTTHPYDYMDAYIGDHASVVDLEVLRSANLALRVDPLGGAGVLYWGLISDRYKLPLTVVNEAVDPTFRFMTLD